MVEKIKLALERAYKQRAGSEGHTVTTKPVTSAIEINPVVDSSTNYSTNEELAKTKYTIVDTDRLREHRIIAFDDQNENIESFRHLRSQVLHYVETAGVTTIGITSPSNEEGKTVVAINLALSIVRTSDTNVVLVDGDISNPNVHNIFGLDVQFGLVDLLNNSVGMADVIQRVNIANLWIVPGRQESVSLSSQASANRVDELVRDFTIASKTIVIVDLPPILGKDDTLVFASSLDGVILVVGEGQTRSEEITRTIGLLKHCNVLGAVMNKSSQKLSGV